MSRIERVADWGWLRWQSLRSAAAVALLGMLFAGVAVLPAAAQQRSKRLILKDGSYQAAIKWEVKGSRVRYYSAERFEWEEIPSTMVDWPATNAYSAKISSGDVGAEARQVSAEEAAERRAEEAKTPTVAPGVKLPSSSGVYMLDIYRDEPSLVELVQSGGEINKQMGSNILRAAINPLAKVRQTIEIKGLHARIQAHVPQPAIYVNVDDPAAAKPDAATKIQAGSHDLDLQPNRYRIARVEARKGSRVVGNLKIALTGKVSQSSQFLETTSEPVSGGWVKVTPAAPLAPGEYALIEMLGKDINVYVWDFGVDPRAPQNSTAWRPVAPPKAETGTNENPLLTGRPPARPKK